MNLKKLPFRNLARRPARTAALVTLVAFLALSVFAGSLVISSLNNGLKPGVMPEEDVKDELSNHGTLRIGYYKLFRILSRYVAPLALLVVLITGIIS